MSKETDKIVMYRKTTPEQGAAAESERLVYLEQQSELKKTARMRFIFITLTISVLLYGSFLIQHLQEEHRAGHHLIYFGILSIYATGLSIYFLNKR